MLRSSISVWGLTETALQVTESVPCKLLLLGWRDGRILRELGEELKRKRDGLELETEEERGETKELMKEVEAINGGRKDCPQALSSVCLSNTRKWPFELAVRRIISLFLSWDFISSVRLSASVYSPPFP